MDVETDSVKVLKKKYKQNGVFFMAAYFSSEVRVIYHPHFHWTTVDKIYELITANDLEGIRSRLDSLSLRERHSIAVSRVFTRLLKYACELRFRDIVKYLLDECGLNVSERHFHCYMRLSPLLIAIYNLDIPMVLLLISRGAVVDKLETKISSYHDFNISNFSMQSIFRCCTHGTSELLPVLSSIRNMALDQDPDTILRATARGEIDEMKILQAYGMDMNEPKFSYDNPLCVAILDKRSHVANHLLNYGIFSLKDHVRALELCGAIFIACQSDIEQGLLCWKKSIRIRKEHFGISVQFSNEIKNGLGVEFTCEKELDMMANSKDELNIQALIVLSRLLPPNDNFFKNTFVNVVKKGVFRSYLLQALKLLGAFSEFLNDPDSEDEDHVEFAIALEFLLLVPYARDPTDISELLLRFKNLFGALDWFDWDVLLTRGIHFYRTLYIDLLRSLTMTIVGMQEFDLCKNDKAWIKDGVSGMMQFPSYCYTTLLHTAIDQAATLPAIAFIVSCTTDVNCIDKDKQTPMHSASDLESEESYILHLVNLLADAGGHIDSMDRDNTAPYMLLQEDGVIINPLKFLSLQCLAAQTIHNYNIEIPEIYPKILVSFIKLHSNVTV